MKDITCIITDDASKTKIPPAISNAISCFEIKLTAPKKAPNAREPVSPMKIFAGGALNHKKPKLAPTIDPSTTQTSAVFFIYVNFK